MVILKLRKQQQRVRGMCLAAESKQTPPSRSSCVGRLQSTQDSEGLGASELPGATAHTALGLLSVHHLLPTGQPLHTARQALRVTWTLHEIPETSKDAAGFSLLVWYLLSPDLAPTPDC